MSSIPDKESFLSDIKNMADFNIDFFKKVYGYYYTDKSFLGQVANELISIHRKDVIEGYNNWFIRWKSEDEAVMKNVASWYSKEQQRLNRNMFRDEPERKVKTGCTNKELLIRRKKELLLQRKKQLLQQKSMR